MCWRKLRASLRDERECSGRRREGDPTPTWTHSRCSNAHRTCSNSSLALTLNSPTPTLSEYRSHQPLDVVEHHDQEERPDRQEPHSHEVLASPVAERLPHHSLCDRDHDLPAIEDRHRQEVEHR